MYIYLNLLGLINAEQHFSLPEKPLGNSDNNEQIDYPAWLFLLPLPLSLSNRIQMYFSHIFHYSLMILNLLMFIFCGENYFKIHSAIELKDKKYVNLVTAEWCKANYLNSLHSFILIVRSFSGNCKKIRIFYFWRKCNFHMVALTKYLDMGFVPHALELAITHTHTHKITGIDG